MKIATREIIREIDRLAIEKYGIPSIVLMENAGRAAADVLVKEFPYANRAAVFAGSGNNGGDGFVIARHLIGQGLKITTYIASDIRKYKGDALINLNALIKMGAKIVELNDNGLRKYRRADVIVDALLGTGIDRKITGFYQRIIEFINAREEPCLAVDIPSGLDSNTGFPLGSTIVADLTVTFVLPKLGTSIYPGAEFAGDIYVADITTPKLLEANIKYELLTNKEVRDLLIPRRPDSHKGTYGHLLILAGSTGKSGAATLAAMGAYRVGSGLVTVGVPESLNAIMEEKTTEAMTEPIPETKQHTFGSVSLLRVLEILSDGKTALTIGPGISTTDDALEFLYEIIRQCEVPILIDADGITLVAKEPKILREAKAPVVLTPHPGEMSRLMGISTEEVQKDRIGLSIDFSKRFNSYLILKGARSLISTPEGNIYVNTTGNAGMASGGMGDVLSGAVGGFLAQGLDPSNACRLGVFAHGLAGDIVANQLGKVGIIARDVADTLPKSLNEIPSMDKYPVTRIR